VSKKLFTIYTFTLFLSLGYYYYTFLIYERINYILNNLCYYIFLSKQWYFRYKNVNFFGGSERNRPFGFSREVL